MQVARPPRQPEKKALEVLRPTFSRSREEQRKLEGLESETAGKGTLNPHQGTKKFNRVRCCSCLGNASVPPMFRHLSSLP